MTELDPSVVVLGICTYHRNDKLEALIEQAARCHGLPGDVRLSVLIADDSAEGEATSVVKALRGRPDLDLHVPVRLSARTQPLGMLRIVGQAG